MRLDKLFTVKNGLASSNLAIHPAKDGDMIPFIRPASSQQRTVAGWIRRTDVDAKNIFPAETIFVSTNGEGSHTYSYVSRFEFVPNSDVSVLIPLKTMPLREKLFYARCITMNRWKFSYGRKPKGDRLKQLDLPVAIPQFVKSVNPIPSMHCCIDGMAKKSTKTISSHKKKLNLVCISQLFDVSYGSNMELCNLKGDENGINFVSRTERNNGVSAKVAQTDESPILGPVLTVAGGGSVLETFLQVEPFYSGRDIYYLRPKMPMTTEELLFYCACIRANKYRYSYGRQANRTLPTITVPSRDSIPSWVYNSLGRVCNQIKTTL
ncbi:MAG: restriction endonuclease [Alphaproteobacteria bacterium]|nr:restriction endonuclease [Alphaproteobacteria bacterium]